MKPETLTDRLALALAELASLPDKEASDTMTEAFSSAHLDVGCGLREDLISLVLLLAQKATDEGQANHSDLSAFYENESEFAGSDHSPRECRKWSRDHGRARDAYARSSSALEKVRDALAFRIRKAGL